jgi:hypothetical protein
MSNIDPFVQNFQRVATGQRDIVTASFKGIVAALPATERATTFLRRCNKLTRASANHNMLAAFFGDTDKRAARLSGSAASN